YGMAMGPLGRLYVTDAAGHAVHVYDVRAGGYSKLNVDGESLIGVATLGGRLFVTDSVGGSVICLNAAGRKQWAVGAEAGLQRPASTERRGRRRRGSCVRGRGTARRRADLRQRRSLPSQFRRAGPRRRGILARDRNRDRRRSHLRGRFLERTRRSVRLPAGG